MRDPVNHTMQDERPLEVRYETICSTDAVKQPLPRLWRNAIAAKFAGLPAILVLAAGVLVTPAVHAHSPSNHGQMHGAMSHASQQTQSQEQYAWGKMGQASDVARDIKISMTDNMRFTPDNLTVKLGETVRFVIRNDGKILHEFVLGTPEDLQKHAELMEKFPNMEHDEPYMAHVDPGQTGEVVWQFNRAGEFDFACLLPGHFQAGMVGKILVQ